MSKMLQQGDSIPKDIIVYSLNNFPVSLNDYRGKWLVLYFYPKDNTPGCTTEACNFRDYNNDINSLGVEIIGVSKDSIDSHKKFQEKQRLNFTLLSDPESKLQAAFGVWIEQSMFGKKYMDTQRVTFIIDPTGIIAHVWPEVSVKTHAHEVYEKLKELTQK